MADELRDRTVAILATDGVEREELEAPRVALDGAGARLRRVAAARRHDGVRGKLLTSWPSIRTDLRNAGAEVVEEEVCVQGQLTTSRGPQDMAAFCAAIVEQFAAAPALSS